MQYLFAKSRLQLNRRVRFLIFVAVIVIAVFLLHSTRENQQNAKTHKVCQPKTKVGFLKTHKCASSSVQNIILRFGLWNELNFVLPPHGGYLGSDNGKGETVHYNRKMISGTEWEKFGLDYSIFAFHTSWDYNEVSKTLNDQGDVTYISIIRDPIDLFVSMWDYRQMGPINDSVLEITLGEPTNALGANQMLRDFGVHYNDVFKKHIVMAKIQEIEKTFQLIMVAERYQDSIVLMKNELCWTYQDVVGFPLNSKDPTKKSKLSDEARKRLKQYLWPDYLLYNHFKKIFNEKFKLLDPDVVAWQKSMLENTTEKVKQECIGKKISSSLVEGEEKIFGVDMIQYQSKDGAKPFCKYYTLKEDLFIDHLRTVQIGRAHKHCWGWRYYLCF